jgi:chromosome segregation ATPase
VRNSKRAQDDLKDLKTQVDALSSGRNAEDIRSFKAELENARGQIGALRAELERLKSQMQIKPMSDTPPAGSK